jgi:predicted dehydrogenase
MSFRANRRRFLQTTAATGLGFWVAGGVSAQPSKSPNQRIAMACIGVGGKGSSDSVDAGKHGDVVAICDTNEHTLNRAGSLRFPKAKCYTDFRKMLDAMGKSIDAVTVSTPDHNHAPAALMAMRLGKHCFCQKPLAHSVYEVRLMAQVAKEKNLATQMGNQGTADPKLRRGAAVIKSGVLGAVKEVHVWTDRPVWPCFASRPKPDPIPSYLNWDAWLGPAPQRPYAMDCYANFRWRAWWDFGTGALGDDACHSVNMAYMALNLRHPTSMQAETSGHNRDGYPRWSKIVYEFPALDGRSGLKLFWYDGKKLPDPALLSEMRALYPKQVEALRRRKLNFNGIGGCIIKGDKATLYAPGDYADQEQKLSGGGRLPEVPFTKSPGHFEEWVRAIRGGEPAMSSFPNYAAGLAETILLGNLAVWMANEPGVGPKVAWDAKNMRSPNTPALEPLLKPTYRAGYTLDA